MAPEEDDRYMRENAIGIIKDFIVSQAMDFTIKAFFEATDLVFNYIKSGIIPSKDEKEKPLKNTKEKPKSKASNKNTKDPIREQILNNVLEKAKKIELSNWWEITEFAIKEGIFKVRTSAETVREQIVENTNISTQLLDALDVKIDMNESIEIQNRKNNSKGEDTSDIPF